MSLQHYHKRPRLRLMLLGEGECGKGTFCEHLEQHYAISSMSTSLMASTLFMYDKLKDKYGYKTPEECHADRRNHRQEWYEGIYEFNTPDLTKLVRRIYERYDACDGVRHAEEFGAVKAKNMFDLSIWLDAGDRTEGEDSSSISVTRDMADVILDNSTTQEDFIRRIDRFMMVMGFTKFGVYKGYTLIPDDNDQILIAKHAKLIDVGRNFREAEAIIDEKVAA